MKTALDFLPRYKQDQIMMITDIIREAAEPEMIILFGSYAKGNYVEHRYVGGDSILYEYVSDFDFLVVVKQHTISLSDLEDIVHSRTHFLDPPVNIEMHDIEYINEGLRFGQYFFTDIVREGVRLYDTQIVKFDEPVVLTKEEEKERAQGYFDIWYNNGIKYLASASFSITNGHLNIAAFLLHQAAESLYYTLLLVFTGYKPKTHNLLRLRKLCKHLSEKVFLLFPIETDKDSKHLFDLLKRGYIDARYKADYNISLEEVLKIQKTLQEMEKAVCEICQDKI
jgi:HEPN domain-containing protein